MARHAAEQPVIAQLEAVTKAFGANEILHGVDLGITQGETVLITGPSGSGKSTTIRMLADLEQPTSGNVALYGNDLAAMKPKARRALIAEKLSFGQQDPALDAGFTVFENMIATASELQPRKRAAVRQYAGELALHFSIAHLLDKPAGNNLSGGEKAKVALSRALVKRPEVLILDEPTSAVDPRGTDQIYAKLRDIQRAEGLTVVMVSHDDVAARTVADREIIIDSGRVANEITY